MQERKTGSVMDWDDGDKEHSVMDRAGGNDELEIDRTSGDDEDG